MKKEGKRITRWKTGATKLQGTAYLKEMAEQGWILEEMNHLTYSFREEEPQYLKYRMEELEHFLSEEEREAYAKDGWQEVCHYELEYIFVKERDPFAEDTEEQKEEIIKNLEQIIELEETTERRTRRWQLIIIGIGLIAAILVLGFSKETLIFIGRMLIRLLPFIVIAYFTSRRRTKRWRREQERVREGDISDDYTDWRKSRRVTVLLIVVLVFGLGVWAFYASDFNEKTFDMPAVVSYEEIPAVRLERLTEEKLTRTGDSIDPDMEGIRLHADIGEGSMYNLKKNMGGFENYGVDHRYLWKTEEKVETKQCMAAEDGTEVDLDTMYHRFRDRVDAVEYYDSQLLYEEEMEEAWKELEMEVPPAEAVPVEAGAFDALHVCRTEWSDTTAYHMLCFKDEQVMELDYNGKELNYELLLVETEKVFAAQMK